MPWRQGGCFVISRFVSGTCTVEAISAAKPAVKGASCAINNLPVLLTLCNQQAKTCLVKKHALWIHPALYSLAASLLPWLNWSLRVRGYLIKMPIKDIFIWWPRSLILAYELDLDIPQLDLRARNINVHVRYWCQESGNTHMRTENDVKSITHVVDSGCTCNVLRHCHTKGMLGGRLPDFLVFCHIKND